MAAAPNLPMSETVTRNIAIGTTYTPSPQGIVVNEGDSINFQNNSGVDIIIEFLTNADGEPVYPPMSLQVSNGGSNSFTAPSYDAAANYNIYNNDVTPPTYLSGPFVIQVGSGPMFVSISGSYSNPSYNPPTVAVPRGSILPPGLGNLQMNSDVPNTDFGIGWTNNSDPFNPGIGSTDGTPHPVNPSASLGPYTYSAGEPGPNDNPANGKVIIQN